MENDERKLSAPDEANKKIAQESVATKPKVQNAIAYSIADTTLAEELNISIEGRKLSEAYIQQYFLSPDMPKPNPNITSMQAQDFILERIKNIVSCDDGKKSEGIEQRIRELSQDISEMKKVHTDEKQDAKPIILLRHSAQFVEANKDIVKILQIAAKNLDLQVAADAEVFNNIASLSIATEQQELKTDEIEKAKALPQEVAQEVATSNLNIPVTNALSRVFDYIIQDIANDPSVLIDQAKIIVENEVGEQAKITKTQELAQQALLRLFQEIYNAQADAGEINTEYRADLDYADLRPLDNMKKPHLALLEELAFTARHQLLHPLLENEAVLDVLTYADSIVMPDPAAPTQKTMGINPEDFSQLGGATAYLQKFDKIIEKLSVDNQNKLALSVAADYTELLQNTNIKLPALNNLTGEKELEACALEVLNQHIGIAPEKKNFDAQKQQFFSGLSGGGAQHFVAILKNLAQAAGNNATNTIAGLVAAQAAGNNQKIDLTSKDELLDLAANPLPIFIETKNLSANMKKVLMADFSKKPEALLQFSIPYANLPLNPVITKNTKAILNSVLQKVTDHNNQELEKAEALLQAYHNITNIKPDADFSKKQQSATEAMTGATGKKLVYSLAQKEKNPLLNLNSNLKKTKKNDAEKMYIAANAIADVDKIFTNNPKAHHLIQNIISCKKLLDSGMYKIVEQVVGAPDAQTREAAVDSKDLVTDPSKLLDMAHNSFHLLSNKDDEVEFLSFEILQRKDQSSDTRRFIIKPAHGLSSTMQELFNETFTITQEKNDELTVAKKPKRPNVPEALEELINKHPESCISKILTEQTQDNAPKINTFDLINLVADAAYLSVSANKALALAITPILSRTRNLEQGGANKHVQLAQRELHNTLKQHIKLNFDLENKTVTYEVDLQRILNNNSIANTTAEDFKKDIQTLNSILRQNKSDKGTTIALNADSTKLIVTQTKPTKPTNLIINTNAEEVVEVRHQANFDSLSNTYKQAIDYLQNKMGAADIAITQNQKQIIELYKNAHDSIDGYITAKYNDKKREAEEYAKLPEPSKEVIKEEKTPASDNTKQESTPANILPEIKEAVKSLQIEEDKEATEAAQGMIQGAYNTIEGLPEKCIIKLKEQLTDAATQPKDEATIAAEKHQRTAMQSIFAAIADAANKKMAEKEAQEATGFFAKAKMLLKRSINTTWSKFAAPIFYSMPLKIKDVLFDAPDKGTELQRAINKACLVQSTSNVEFAITGFALLLSDQQSSDADKEQLNKKVDALLKKFDNIKIDETNTNTVLAAILSGNTSSIEIVAQNDKKAVTPAKAPTAEKQQSAPSTKTDIINAVAANANVKKQASIAIA